MDKVLLVEDNPGHAHLLREMMRRTASAQFELTHVERLEQALAHLDKAPSDLLLLDLSLPDSQGFETFARARALAPDTPIIVLSGYEDEELAIRAVQEGAQDYLIKGQVDGNLLARAIRYAIERGRAEALVRAQRDLGLALGAAAGLEQVLRLCVEAALRVSGMDYGGVYLVDGASGDLDLAYQQGLSPELAQSLSHLDANSMQARMVMAGQSIYSSPQELNLPLDAPSRREGLRAMSVVPVYHEGQVVACLGVASRTLEQAPVFARNALEVIASQIGSVIARVQAESQRDAMLEALQESNEQVVNVLDSISDGFVALDNDQVITYFNKAAERLLGQESTKVLGRRVFEVFPMLAGTVFEENYVRSLKEGKPLSYEAYLGVKLYENWFDVRISPYEEGVSLYFQVITERVRAQEQLRFQAQLLDSVREAVVAADLEGSVIYWGKGAEALYGYAAEEVMGRPVISFIEPRGQEKQQMRQLVEMGVWSDRHVQKRKDGSFFWADAVVSLVTDQDGQPVGMIGIDRDITQQVQAEQELRKFKTISDSADYGVCIADLAGNITFINPCLAAMHGYEPGELIGQNLTIFHGGAQLGEVLERRVELQEQGNYSAVEMWSRRKDGSTFPALIRGAIIKDQDDKPLFMTATMTDITQREQAKSQRDATLDALRESEQRYRTLFESASIGVGLSTLDGKALAGNEALLQMMGYFEADIQQVSLADTYAQPQARALLLERLQRDGFVKDFEVRLKRKDGTTYYASLTVTRVTLGGEDVLLTMAQDITERVRAQEQLEHYAFELERSNQELQRFIHVASHDLQEPLRMVTSYLQLLERRYKGQLDADADDFIAFAVNGATRMRTLIKDLLAYSEVAARGKPFEPTDCQAVLEQVLNNLQATVEESGASVTHAPLPTVMADGAQLAQLFHDLIGNAIKFRGERRLEIHVGAERRESEWLFSVRDNGTGIEPQYFERIFHIFQRLHTQAEYPGTGIGLAICKRIVERHGGRLWVESEPGEGSTFYFTLLEDVTAAVTS